MSGYIGRLLERGRRDEDFISLTLLIAILATMVVTVLEVDWVPEDEVIFIAAAGGFILTALLARRPLDAWKAWILITLYGFLVVTLTLARLWPPFSLLIGDWGALRMLWMENGAEFISRWSFWINALVSGGRSNETIIFAYLMGLLAWFLAAFITWSALRLQRPLLSLIITGLVIALNGYFGAATNEYAVLFVGLAVIASAVLHFRTMERGWQSKDVDYSREIQMEIILYAATIAITLLALSYIIPSIQPSRIAMLILGQPAVAQMDDTLDRAFGGVDVARGRPVPAGQPGGSGTMPRAFLLGNPPQLEQNIMMTASVQIPGVPSESRPSLARHWRGLSYQLYTGRGWSLSEENEENLAAADPAPVPPAADTITLIQDVHWRFDNRVIRYTLGQPLTFDHDTIIYLRGVDDLVRVRAQGVNQYQVTSRISIAAPDALRQSPLSAVPSSIINHYTQLPSSLPQRVRDLAQEIAGDADNPYDQARRLERFLRQYEYSLDVPLPPEGSDTVDFFLFELQRGYCDYYASSMVVMARSLGLPARVATGFLAQPPDAQGVQTLRQINSHSWAEIYFAGYGWIEFEPTAAFVSPQDAQILPGLNQEPDPQAIDETSDIAPIPDRDPRLSLPWSRIAWLILLLLSGASLLIWWNRQPKFSAELDRVYYKYQKGASKLGLSRSENQTPNEFSDQFLDHVQTLQTGPRTKKWSALLREPVLKLTGLVNKWYYSPDGQVEPGKALSHWKRMRRPLWLLRIKRWFNR